MKKTIIALTLFTSFTSFTAAAGSFPVDLQTYGFDADSYRYAETALAADHYANNIGLGVNVWNHIKEFINVADQKVIRTNNDSLYSIAVIDVSDGADITVPEMYGRYFSIAIIDMFHFTEQVITTPGTHKIKADSDYVVALLRTSADNMNQADIDHVVNNIQPNFTISAQSSVPFVKGDIDIENMLAARKEIVAQGMKEQSLADMMGPRGKVDDWRHLMGTAMAWGVLPDREASYKVVDPKLADTQCYSATFAEPENEGFWSITMYDKQGFLYSDDHGILNGYNRQTNKDGTTTVHFGSAENCGKYAVNRLDVTDGWNFLLRVYRPDLEDFHNYQLPEFVKI